MAGETSIVSCAAPLGQGGMGRHLADVVHALQAEGNEVRCFDTGPSNSASITSFPPRWSAWLARYTPVRFATCLRFYLANVEFDRRVAARLPKAHRLVAFQGSALTSFRKARALGYAELHLESAGAHVNDARRRFDEAYRRHPLERDWLSDRLRRRTLAEYEAADVIWVNSEYARETFLKEGTAPEKLRRRHLTVDPRYAPIAKQPHVGLHVVSIGSLSVAKGTPVLVEAFAKLADPQARLTLIGGSGSSGMRRFLETAVQADPRIKIAPGDPLPHLRSADVCIHASYSDGFGYGPAEALACGVPVVATEDTGMKELIVPGRNGWIVPTGDVEAIAGVLRNLRRQEAIIGES